MSVYKIKWGTIIFLFVNFSAFSQPIDRKALVTRHNIVNTSYDTLQTLTVGNGKFAFSVDFTGLQTFPVAYKNGIPLGTESEWGWHSFPNSHNYKFSETLQNYEVHDKEVSYAVQVKDPEHAKEASDYFRSNPHRFHLGFIGFLITDSKGNELKPKDISDIHQELDLWDGEIRSSFSALGKQVEVITICDAEKDMVSFKVKSELLNTKNLKISFRFPYPTGAHTDMGGSFQNDKLHKSIMSREGKNGAVIERKLDTTEYFTKIRWNGTANLTEKAQHYFELSSNSKELKVSVLFTPRKTQTFSQAFDELENETNQHWNNFWLNGAAVDFSGSTDKRAAELERRVVLSQYLTATQCAGHYPPQETGLTYNSWYGKFHLEMAWWHLVHFALWNRIDVIENIMPWYSKVAGEAFEIAKRQGYNGLRWQKMTDPSGAETSSSVGAFLIWQQPHYIYFAELCYRNHQDKATLEKYKDLVFATADFMASYAWKSKNDSTYTLGPALIPAQECFDAQTTTNPPLELAYWYWGLATAKKWAERLNIPAHPQWQKVMAHLPKLSTVDDLYVPAASTPMAYKDHTHMHDHPAVFGALGMLPASPLVNKETMKNTFSFIWKNWEWDQTWGWDFPLTAMTATRLGMPEKAIDALFMDEMTNTYLSNGHNYQDGRLRLYLPGNGGLLTAVAMMCAGYDGCNIQNPGIPKDGTWKVKWEGLKKMP